MAGLPPAPPNFQVDGITRVTNHATVQHIRRGYGQHTAVLMNNRVFQPLDAVPNVNTEGFRPTAFTLDKLDIALRLTGTFATFPAGNANYYVRGTGPGGFIIRSQNFQVDVAGLVPAQRTFTAATFSFNDQAVIIESPFRVAGNFTWELLVAGANTVIAASAVTQLELYFFLANTMMTQRPILDLIRMTVPDYITIATHHWADVENAIVQNIVRNLWQLGTGGGAARRRYDARRNVGGKSLHYLGSTLNLRTFMERNPFYCNCVDLAALVAAAFYSLGRRGGMLQTEVLTPQMESRTPWGFVPAGPLFGWNFDPYWNCNSPFWLHEHTGNDIGTAWNVADDSFDRRSFGMHTYVRFENAANQHVVVDICHGVGVAAGPDNLARGTVRDTYFQDSIQVVYRNKDMNSVRLV